MPASATPVSIAQAVAEEPPDSDFDSCVERGVRAVLDRDFATAIVEFEKAHALRPKEPMIMHRLERLRLLQRTASAR